MKKSELIEKIEEIQAREGLSAHDCARLRKLLNTNHQPLSPVINLDQIKVLKETGKTIG